MNTVHEQALSLIFNLALPGLGRSWRLCGVSAGHGATTA
jgi:hypothetical protein